jgi:hypothetical protein
MNSQDTLCSTQASIFDRRSFKKLGSHSLLMIGPPKSGKTATARSIGGLGIVERDRYETTWRGIDNAGAITITDGKTVEDNIRMITD